MESLRGQHASGSTSAPIRGSRVSHQAPSRPLGCPGLESSGGGVDVVGAHICHSLTDVPCALTETPGVLCLPADDSSTPGGETGSKGADLAGSRGRVSDPLPGPRAGRPHQEALTPPFTHGETEAQRHHFLCAQQVVTGPREAAAVCCLFVLSLILSFNHHYLPGDAKPGAGWQLVTVRSGGRHGALLTAAVLRARLRGPKARGAAGASPGDGSARCCDVRQVS